MGLSGALLIYLPVLAWVGYTRFAAPGTIPEALDMGPLEMIVAPPGRAALLAAGLSLLPALGALYALWQAQALFALYRGGETLSPAPARRIGRIGWGLLAAAGLGLAVRPAVAVALTAANPPGTRLLAVSFGSGDVGLGLAAGLMIVIGWVMREAAAVAEENRSFV
ncbi:MAG: DUF2975 domain-containing protein [Paracoccaceae bacterium]